MKRILLKKSAAGITIVPGNILAALSVLVIVLAVTSCRPITPESQMPAIAVETTDATAPEHILASATVLPAQEAHLSFVISGQVKEVTVEEGSAVASGQILATLSSPELEYGVLQAEAAMRQAEFDFEYWELPRRVGNQVVERGPVAIQELETTRKSLNTVQAELAQTQLVTPFAATVVSVEVQPGEYVGPGQVVIVLANLNNLIIETTDLSELNVAAITIDQPATVYVEALDQELPGAVTAISPISDTIGDDVVFKVTIKLDDRPADLLWGMSADVEIQTEQ